MFCRSSYLALRSSTFFLRPRCRSNQPSEVGEKIMPAKELVEFNATKLTDTLNTKSNLDDVTHVKPQTVLKRLTTAILKTQVKIFAGTENGGSDVNHNSLFSIINNAYEERMRKEKETEVETFLAKRRAYFEQRLNEETEEFRRERREVYEEVHRRECDNYKKDLLKDIADFMALRKKECEVRLQEDVDKYHGALQTYREQLARESGENLEKHLSSNVSDTVDKLETENEILNFGTSASGVRNDLTDDDISTYVEQRLFFYEKCLQEEMSTFAQRRKSFYEELLQARAVRHAARIRFDTEKFRDTRLQYYENRLNQDSSWMSESLHSHYERCFLYCYSRHAWLCFRQGDKNASGISLGKVTLSDLNQALPLLNLLDIYSQETIEEITRDIFLKAARRIADEGAGLSETNFFNETEGE